MTRRHPSITSKLAPAVLIAVLLAVWQLCSDLGVVPKFMLPSPTDVVTAFVEDFPALITHARVSLSEAFLGLGTAVILSFAVAFLMDQFRVVFLPFSIIRLRNGREVRYDEHSGIMHER